MKNDLKYLRLLAEKFPTDEAVTTEIINLEAIMNLPKGTEHFISDLHGEYEAFEHVLRNGSGSVKEKIVQLFGDEMTEEELNSFATLVYYPEEKLPLIIDQYPNEEDREKIYSLLLRQLLDLTLLTSRKYTRSKVRKALPKDFAYIIEELLFRDDAYEDKEAYYQSIIQSIIKLDRAPALITELALLVQRFTVDHLHVVGDIYDRGPYPEKIMDRLKTHHSFDIQWGNHDILWVGAASGNAACLMNVIRICARYDNLSIIEDSYGISLRHFQDFAQKTYSDQVGSSFIPKQGAYSEGLSQTEELNLAKIQQAAAIIQFKLEKPIIDRHPEFEAEDRLLLDKINYEDMTVTIEGQTYPLENAEFPTIDPADPYALTEEEEEITQRLVKSFEESEVLQDHMAFMINNGSMHKVYNGNLLFHGCLPMTEDGDFMEVAMGEETYSGRALYESFDRDVRNAYFKNCEAEVYEAANDRLWYLWQGKGSPLFGKEKMTTFERYYIQDKDVQKEKKNPYYSLREDPEVIDQILLEFGVDDPHGIIVNGHTPVKEAKGENPIKADGRMVVIDGGFSKDYQKTTGVGGYTLIYNSYGMQLATHEPFESRDLAIQEDLDNVTPRRLVDKELKRKRIRDTDIGKELTAQRDDLLDLLAAYRSGQIVEKY